MLLYAEDNPVNQRLIRDICAARGYDVDIVEDGRQAVDAVTNREYDLILMDVHMPNMDGIQATAEIRKLGGKVGNIPVFVLTADDTPEIRQRCVSVGVTKIFIKPLNFPRLLEAIGSVAVTTA